MLHALLRVPATGFATHDDPQRIQQLLTERADHEAVLAGAPPDRRPALRQAEHELRAAREAHHWAKYRLNAAHQRLDSIGPLSLLRRQHRHDKSAALDDIARFGDDVTRAAAKVASCERTHDTLPDEIAQGDAWHTEHEWRRRRMTAIDAELDGLGHIDVRCLPLPNRSPASERGLSRTSRFHSRLAEMAALPARRRHGAGMDLGL